MNRFRKIEIVCPVCGQGRVFTKVRGTETYINTNSKLKIELDNEFEGICTNKECSNFNLEFIQCLNLTEFEREFAYAVLFRGEREGLWVIDKMRAGGDRAVRGIAGLDFILWVQNPPLAFLIEFKRGSSLHFTRDQWNHFRMSRPLTARISRLVLIVTPDKKKDVFTRAFYWSPQFFRTLPEEMFGRREDFGVRYLRWRGSTKCIKRNRENAFYEMERGILGGVQAVYKFFPLEVAYNWFYEKLKKTLSDPQEAAQKVYKPCSLETIPLKDRVYTILLNLINSSYRPIFPEDAIPIQRNKIADVMSKKGKTDYILNMTASSYNERRLLELSREPKTGITAFQIGGVKSYGLVKWMENYIFLPKAESWFLDILYDTWKKTKRSEFTGRDVIIKTGGDLNAFRRALKKVQFRKILQQKGLVEFEVRAPKPTFIKITDKAINYFSRIGI